MNEFFRKIINQVLDIWKNLSVPQRTIFFSVIFLLVVGVTAVIFFGVKDTVVPLYSQANPKDIAEIRDVLAQNSYWSRVVGNGRTILVKQKDKNNIIPLLAKNDLIPDKGQKGFKLFDKFDLSITDFERRIKLLRAVKGELSRAYESFEHVQKAQVMIPHVEKKLFDAEQQPITASVVLQIDPPDFKFSNNQIRSMKKIAAHAIAGLSAERVNIVNQFSEELIPMEPITDPSALAPRQLQIQNRLARKFKDEIMDSLGNALGRDKIVSMVTVEMNWDKQSIESVEKDLQEWQRPKFGGKPVQLLTSKEDIQEHLEGEGIKPKGEVGIKPNEPQYKGLRQQGNWKYENKESRENFEFPNEIKKQREIAPYIKRLTASVMIDGTWEVTLDNKKDIYKRQYHPRSDEEMKKLASLVRNAIGYNDERNDQVTVENVQFDRSREFAAADSQLRSESQKRQSAIIAAIVVSIIILAMVLMREMQKHRKLREEDLARQREMEQLAVMAEEEEVALSLEDQERLEITRRAIQMAKQKPEMVAELLRTWMAEDEAA